MPPETVAGPALTVLGSHSFLGKPRCGCESTKTQQVSPDAGLGCWGLSFPEQGACRDWIACHVLVGSLAERSGRLSNLGSGKGSSFARRVTCWDGGEGAYVPCYDSWV